MAKRPPSLRMPSLALKRFSGPLHRRVFLALREGIRSGDLCTGERLPSSRALAKELAISRHTVLNAYDKLAEEGFTIAKVGSGTRVTSNIPKVGEFSLLYPALAPHALTSPAAGNKPGLSLATVLERSHYPLRRASFLDRDGNALYLYSSHICREINGIVALEN
jgi:DNA-binding transcriptional regulator YhcF (GntR family)